MLPERRSHPRIFTLKNFARFLVLAVVFLAGLSLEVSMRDHSGDYGRLVNKEIPHNHEIRPKPQPIVEAPPVADQAAADPLLIDSAAREQEFLSTTTTQTTTTARAANVTIAGDTAGIVIRRSSEVPKRPVLAGGIFTQP